MKKIYLIGGAMGVGKTTVCNLLNKELKNSVYLDGDWCWNMDPFIVNEETKKMVIDNICYLLNNYINCSIYENIIFSWVMHEQNIIDDIISKLNINDCVISTISLICTKEELEKRLNKDINLGIRDESVIERSLDRLKYYDSLNTIKIDTTRKEIEQIVNKIKQI